MKTLKEQRGITLIALIITIIVMLILVGITISVSLNGGLFETAQVAKQQTRIQTDREQLFSAVIGALGENGKVDYTKLDSNLPEGFTGSNGTYINTETGNMYEVYLNGSTVSKANNVSDGLLEYLLGEKDKDTGARPGRNLSDIVNLQYYTFLNVPEEVGQLTFITLNPVEYITENNDIVTIADAYFVNETPEGKQIKYKVRVKSNETTGEGITLPENGVKEISYDTNTRVGKYVEYDNKNWIIIYDDNVNGLQMISEDTMLNENDELFDLGGSDEIYDAGKNFDENLITEVDGVTGKSYLERAMYSYDNAITNLNSFCDGVVADSEYIKSVRSVGSNPSNPNYDNPKSFIGSAQTIPAYESLTWFEDNLNLTKNVEEGRTYYTIGDTETEYKIKGTDMNCEQDFDRMVALGIHATAENYWLASRMVYLRGGGVRFAVRLVDEGVGSSYDLWRVSPDYATSNYPWYAVRPVVSLSSTVQFEGEGTSASPYTIK